MFILNGDFDSDPYNLKAMHDAFKAYRGYLESNRNKFLPSLFSFALEQSNEDINNKNFLHDSWVDSINVRESRLINRRKVDIDIKLIGPYHDRYLLLKYGNVKSYVLNFDPCFEGHGDYTRGEVRLSPTEEGFFVHEFDWNYLSRSRIEFASFEYSVEINKDFLDQETKLLDP